MAGKGSKYPKNKVVAKLVCDSENRQPCVFCQQDVDDEVIYGKLYSLGDIQCHYFCVLLSCCLVQKGRDTEGLFGFLYKDIVAEVERSKKHKCSYCGRGGASLGCCITQCRKQFHLPCGRRKNVISLFYGNYKSFCELHAPKQKISEDVMANAKVRMKKAKMLKSAKVSADVKEIKQSEQEESVCVICYEEVQGYPTTQTFWPPCCGRDAWLHRSCLQRMALSAGMHYLKCPLCNDKERFYEAVCDQGYYLPDRDAAWELEQNAFAEMYERPASCGAATCKCPFGRAHDEPGIWDIKLCLLCGSCGLHAPCAGAGGAGAGVGVGVCAARVVCASCRPAAGDLDQLEGRLAEVLRAEHERAHTARTVRAGPLMPSRMSLRRTKGRVAALSASSSSQSLPIETTSEIKTEIQSPKTESTSRQELNLKTPKRPVKFLEPSILKDLENKLLSPVKMLEQSYMEKLGGAEDILVNSNEVIAKMRAKFNKPRPLCQKKRIINEIIEDLFSNVFEEGLKSKDAVKEWLTPKKCLNLTEKPLEDVKENSGTIQLSDPVDTNEAKGNLENGNNIMDINNSIGSKIDEECSNNDINDEANKTEGATQNDSTADERDTSRSDDESSNSTFQLPPEFIAESDDSLPIFDTPKKLKTIDIKQNSSIEISEHDEIVNIDVVQRASGKENDFIKNLNIKSPVKNKKCSFKFSPIDKETLQVTNVDIDVESFKDQYLNEVDRKFECNYNHNHLKSHDKANLRTVIDFAVDATRKRKLEPKEKGDRKRKKELKCEFSDTTENNHELARERKRLKKLRKKKDHRRKGDRNIRLKIKWKDGTTDKIKDGTKVNIKVKSKEKQEVKSFKQYVLKYSPLKTNVIAKPEIDVTRMKRKYVKLEKSPDNLVQTSIQSFFKVK